MPNQIVSKETQSILSHYETVNENLTAIASLSALVIDAEGGCTDSNDIDVIMLLIGRLQREASQANNAIWEIVKGGEQ